MTTNPDPAWLEDVPGLDALGEPPVRHTNAHLSRLLRDEFLPHVRTLGDAPEAVALWGVVLRGWSELSAELRADAIRALWFQAISIVPGFVDSFGIPALVTVVTRLVIWYAPMAIAMPELAAAMALAPESWLAQLEMATKTPLGREVSSTNRREEASLIELYRRLRFEGYSPSQIDAMVQRWERELRDAARSYDEQTKRGRPKGVQEPKPRKLPATREKRYRDSFALPMAQWAALHEPDLTEPWCHDDLREEFLKARVLAKKHGLDGPISP
jgi:hypothetical protein